MHSGDGIRSVMKEILAHPVWWHPYLVCAWGRTHACCVQDWIRGYANWKQCVCRKWDRLEHSLLKVRAFRKGNWISTGTLHDADYIGSKLQSLPSFTLTLQWNAPFSATKQLKDWGNVSTYVHSDCVTSSMTVIPLSIILFYIYWYKAEHHYKPFVLILYCKTNN